ncbi:proline-rich protein 36-like [Pristis pectinata]|uniref:proline-rich protein 36-like n=1 Tax=Pristis pectinata TaxID=685728 RepID=UPI00223DC70F|nr:proline-rich protein 36-like [Pristis pectinata]
MGNTHSEGAVQREREAVEVLRKDREDEKAGWRSNPGKDEQPRAPPALACGLEPGVDSQAREGDANPQRGFSDDPAPALGTAADAKVKPSQGKKRKIAKARKWASGQVAFQEPVVDKPVGERLQPLGRAGQGRASSSKPGVDPLRAVPPPGFLQQGREAGPDCQPGSPRPGAGSRVPESMKQDPSDTRCHKAGTGSAHRGQGEPTGPLLQLLPPLPPTSQNKGGKRAQLSWAPQGETGPTTAQSSQGSTNGKESPCKLIKLSTIQPTPGPVVDRGAQGHRGQQEGQLPARQEGEVGKPSSPATGSEAQSRPDRLVAAKVRVDTPACVKRALGPAPDPTPCPGRLKTHSFLTKRGAHVDPAPGPPGTMPPRVDPLSVGAKPAPGARKGTPASISYAEALKQGTPPASPREHTVLPSGGAQVPRPELGSPKEPRDVPQVQDSASAASKKKLPFYEQLIASLKSQAQRQRGSKVQRPIPGQEGPDQCRPAKAEAEATQEAPSTGPVMAETLALPGPDAQPEPEPPPAPQLSFQLEAHLRPPQPGAAKAEGDFAPWVQPIFRFQSQLLPREEAEVYRSISFLPQGPAAGPPQQHPPMAGTGPPLGVLSQSWLRLQDSTSCRLQLQPLAEAWPEPGASTPSLYPWPGVDGPALEQLPVWPMLEGQSQGQAELGTVAQLQCQQLLRPAAPVPLQLQLQIACNIQQQSQPPAQDKAALQQQQKLTQPQASPKVQLQPEPRANSKPSAPAPAQPKLAASRPPKPEQLPPRAPAQVSASAKARPQAQAKGRKVPPSCPAQLQEPAQAEAAQRPAGRWAAFQVDKTCTRKCHCRHREDQLPRNITAW